TVTASDPDDAAVTVTCTPPSGSPFAIATTTVSCIASDAAGNQTTGSFTVTVRDTTPPVLSLPLGFDLAATSSAGAVATFPVSAQDLVDAAPPPLCDHHSGDTYSLGSTTVTCSVSDAHGNSASGSFTIRVRRGDHGGLRPGGRSGAGRGRCRASGCPGPRGRGRPPRARAGVPAARRAPHGARRGRRRRLRLRRREPGARASARPQLFSDAEHAWARLPLSRRRGAAARRDPRGSYDQAVTRLREALEITPRNTGAADNLGLAWKNRGVWELEHGVDPRPSFESAVANYQRAIDIDAQNGSLRPTSRPWRRASPAT